MSKKSYMSLLKEAIAEFDTSDHLDVKGPMLDPILSWEGDGELPIYKDAASILERYYFNEDNDKGVETMDEGELQADYQNDKGSAGGESMKNAEGTGTEQAGTSDSDTIAGAKKDKEKDIAKESYRREQEEVEDEDEESTTMENAIIEKLISEMEEDDEDDDENDEDEKEEEMEESEVMSYTGDGPKDEAPKEKKATGPEQDTHGAGTEQAGTGSDEGQIPPRKDIHDKLVKPKTYTDENTMIEAALAELEREIAEQDEMPAPDGDEGGDDEDKDLNVDKKMNEADSAVPGGPSPKKKGEDWEDDEEAYSEAFRLFKEAIEDDEDEDEEKEED